MKKYKKAMKIHGFYFCFIFFSIVMQEEVNMRCILPYNTENRPKPLKKSSEM